MNLYRFQDQVIGSATFIEKLAPLIRPGDTVYAEVDAMKFGKLYDAQISRSDFLNELFQIFYQLVGENGNIIIPSFTYSWGDTSPQKFFDIQKTRGRVGIFPEFFRKMKGTVRTLDPMFSFSIYGKDKLHFKNISNNSFGRDSIFHKMHQVNAKLVSFGLNQFDPTFVHYLEQYYDEQIETIGYRFLKKFEGELVDEEGCCYQSTHYSFMRQPGSRLFFDEHNVKQKLCEKQQLGIVEIGAAQVFVSDCNSFFDVGIEGLRHDKMFFIQEATDHAVI